MKSLHDYRGEARAAMRRFNRLWFRDHYEYVPEAAMRAARLAAKSKSEAYELAKVHRHHAQRMRPLVALTKDVLDLARRAGMRDAGASIERMAARHGMAEKEG